MREIKFRAWDGVFHYFRWDSYCFYEMHILELENDDVIWQQWTGLTDLRGKDIYEGDICSVNDKKPEMLGMYGEFGVVVFRGCTFGMELSDTKRFVSIQEKDIEVIGNIYEDKHLLGDDE